jgi:hypothetical protein
MFLGPVRLLPKLFVPKLLVPELLVPKLLVPKLFIHLPLDNSLLDLCTLSPQTFRPYLITLVLNSWIRLG